MRAVAALWLGLCCAPAGAWAQDRMAGVPAAARRLAERYDMKPIPVEGGCFRQVWRSDDVLPGSALPARYGGRAHPAGTAIIGIETVAGFSGLHRLLTDEVWHFHGGDPIAMLLLHPDGRSERVVLGPERPVVVVPRGVWQGSRPAGPAGWSLFGTTMAPGFTAGDFTAGERGALQRAYPGVADEIGRLTRDGAS